MKIKSVYIEQGLFYTKREFKDGINLIFSKKNSTGKTTLIRCLLYGLGYNIPGTKNFKMEQASVCVELVLDDKREVILKRHSQNLIELNIDDKQFSYVLPAQMIELHKVLFCTDNEDILNNLLGSIYADQEKGWTLLNRGKAIAGIRFNIDELIRGLSGRDCSDLILKRKKIEENLNKYKQILNIAEYREAVATKENSFVAVDYDKERVIKIDQLKVERNQIQKEIKRLDYNIANNRKAIDFIDAMKLIVRLDDGEEICVTKDMVVGANDSLELLKAKKAILLPRLQTIIKEIESLELEVEEETQQLSLFKTETLAEVFDKKIVDVDVDPISVQKAIRCLEKEKSTLNKAISEITNNNNTVTMSMLTTVRKYMVELGDDGATELSWKYLFTSRLKELSGVVLHKTVFSFRLAYIVEIEKKLGIKLPIILDSPKGKEVDDANVKKMMQILQRDFSDNQIIIASIYHYVENENVIEMKNQLLDQVKSS